ncbi:MAG: hypothetical protein MHM6MM_006913 [Cercozoa sp. M6MM]
MIRTCLAVTLKWIQACLVIPYMWLFTHLTRRRSYRRTHYARVQVDTQKVRTHSKNVPVSDMPEKGDNVSRWLLISDVHGEWRAAISNVVDNATRGALRDTLGIDVLILAGDTFWGQFASPRCSRRFWLRRLDSFLGCVKQQGIEVYVVPGNHDYVFTHTNYEPRNFTVCLDDVVCLASEDADLPYRDIGTLTAGHCYSVTYELVTVADGIRTTLMASSPQSRSRNSAFQRQKPHLRRLEYALRQVNLQDDGIDVLVVHGEWDGLHDAAADAGVSALLTGHYHDYNGVRKFRAGHKGRELLHANGAIMSGSYHPTQCPVIVDFDKTRR